LCTIWRVHHFRVELNCEILTLFIRNRCERCIWRRANNLEAFRKRCNAVAVAHPDLMTCALSPNASEQCAVFLNFEERAAEFTVVAAFDLATQLGAHGLLAIANA